METMQEMVRKQEWLQEINGNPQKNIRQQTLQEKYVRKPELK